MSASLPPNANAENQQRKWLPWVIGIAVVAALLFWMRGCGKEPVTGVTTDTTQTTMTAAPADTAMGAMPATGDTARMPDTGNASTGPARSPSSGRKSTAAGGTPAPAVDTAPAAAPGNDGVGAMGGHGASGKKAPTAPEPTPQAQQKP
ncbi:MAG: hypothetical protein H6Q77_2209 [Gemmatimonadetes bacterium]|nr:hypothetical protein [Gemmatimonadota bacterium]